MKKLTTATKAIDERVGSGRGGRGEWLIFIHPWCQAQLENLLLFRQLDYFHWLFKVISCYRAPDEVTLTVTKQVQINMKKKNRDSIQGQKEDNSPVIGRLLALKSVELSPKDFSLDPKKID